MTPEQQARIDAEPGVAPSQSTHRFKTGDVVYLRADYIHLLRVRPDAWELCHWLSPQTVVARTTHEDPTGAIELTYYVRGTKADRSIPPSLARMLECELMSAQEIVDGVRAHPDGKPLFAETE